MMRLAILGSTRGSHLPVIQNAILQQKLAAKIEIVISNKSDALILEKAKALSVPNIFIDARGLNREHYDELVSSQLKKYQVDLILLIGYMRILSANFVNQWSGRVLNVHPSLLPKHAGLMDLAVHQAVLRAEDRETGCTVHEVTEEVDRGPIIVQKRCPVLSDDTAESLKARVQVLEAEALIESIEACSLLIKR